MDVFGLHLKKSDASDFFAFTAFFIRDCEKLTQCLKLLVKFIVDNAAMKVRVLIGIVHQIESGVGGNKDTSTVRCYCRVVAQTLPKIYRLYHSTLVCQFKNYQTRLNGDSTIFYRIIHTV